MAILDRPTVHPAVLDTVRAARRAPVRRHRLVVSGLSLALVGAFAARVLLGDFTFTVPDFFRVLLGAEIPGATYILMETKLPRAVLAVLVGFAFGISGALFQSTFRNALSGRDAYQRRRAEALGPPAYRRQRRDGADPRRPALQTR